MDLNRQELLALATTVGLVLGVDFEKNISNANLQKKIEEKQEQLANDLKNVDSLEDEEEPQNNQEPIEEEDNALIMRKTECFTYRTEIIGFKETARRSNLTVEEVKEAIETGKPAGGYIFEFVG